MIHLRSLALVAALAAVALPSFGQQTPATPAAQGASASKSSMDCGPAGMKPHDHAAEKGMGSSMKGVHCGDDKAKSSTAAKAKKKPLHDHAKEHKQQ
jgi:hypothetical protein